MRGCEMTRPAIDHEAVAEFLQQRFEDAADTVELDSGVWSRAYGFTAEGRDLVVRFGEYREDYEKDRLAASFAAPDLPIPAVFEVGEALGRVYALAPRAFGGFLEALDEPAYRAALPSLLRALDALRAVEPPGEGFGPWNPAGEAPYGSWQDYLLDVTNDRGDGRTGGWRPLLESRPGAAAAFERGYAALEQLVGACPEVRHVVHTDLFAGNVLVDEDRVTAVLDWGNSIYGDFLYDLAHIAFWMPWFPTLEGIDLAAEASAHYATAGIEVPAFEERMRSYMIHIGLDAQSYTARTERWDELDRSAQRTLEVAGA